MQIIFYYIYKSIFVTEYKYIIESGAITVHLWKTQHAYVA